MSSKKAEARERVKAMREEQAKKDRARERMMRFGIAIAVLVGVAIIAVAVISSRDGGDGEVPTAVAGEYDGIQVGEADAPVTIETWIDFLCPHCKEFEDANAAQIDEWVDAGQVNVIYYPVTFTGRTYSTRANNAFACAAEEGKASEFVKAAFAAPQQWTNNSLVELGESAGIGGDYSSCVRGETYNGWSSDVTRAAADVDEVEGTPSVFVNGEKVEDWSPSSLATAVQEAGADIEAPPAGQPTNEPTGEPTDGAAEQDGGDADGGESGAGDE